jgi:hypothetical protein
MRRSITVGSAACLLLAFIAAFALKAPASLGQTRVPFGVRLVGPGAQSAFD